jgi:chloramphenicol 3-O phosphotransferase
VSKIILMNGASSSGKTLISQGIQTLTSNLWLVFGVDIFMSMIPYDKEEVYFSFTPGKNDYGPTARMGAMPEGMKLFGDIPDFVGFAADRGYDLIVDEILLGDGLLKKYAYVLRNHTVYLVNVFCERKRLQEREILRRDRRVGLANDQMDRIHEGLRDHCDLRVEATHDSPFEVAAQILSYVQKNPHPQAFEILRQGLTEEEKVLGVSL